MKSSYAVITWILQLILLFLSISTIKSETGLYFAVGFLIASIALGIFYITKKDAQPEIKDRGWGILIGTAITLFMIGTFAFWLSRSFSR
jgi:low temperature requirement protein LtrA